MALYQVVYTADNRKYIAVMKGTSKKHIQKQMEKFFENMEYEDGFVDSIKRIE